MRSNILHRVLLEHFTKKASSGSISALNVVLQAGCVLLLLNSSIKDTFLPRLHLEIVAILLFNIICLANPACCFLVFPIVRRKIKILYSCNVMSLGGGGYIFWDIPARPAAKITVMLRLICHSKGVLQGFLRPLNSSDEHFGWSVLPPESQTCEHLCHFGTNVICCSQMLIKAWKTASIQKFNKVIVHHMNSTFHDMEKVLVIFRKTIPLFARSIGRNLK